MKLNISIALLFSSAFAAPVANPNPSIKEVLLAHTNVGEFAAVHLGGLATADFKLLAAAHSPAEDPPNALAAKSKRDLQDLKKRGIKDIFSKAVTAAVSGAPATITDSDAQYNALFVNGDPNGKLNAKGAAALTQAMGMAKVFGEKNPQMAGMLAGLQAFAAKAM